MVPSTAARLLSSCESCYVLSLSRCPCVCLGARAESGDGTGDFASTSMQQQLRGRLSRGFSRSVVVFLVGSSSLENDVARESIIDEEAELGLVEYVFLRLY